MSENQSKTPAPHLADYMDRLLSLSHRVWGLMDGNLTGRSAFARSLGNAIDDILERASVGPDDHHHLVDLARGISTTLGKSFPAIRDELVEIVDDLEEMGIDLFPQEPEPDVGPSGAPWWALELVGALKAFYTEVNQQAGLASWGYSSRPNPMGVLVERLIRIESGLCSGQRPGGAAELAGLLASAAEAEYDASGGPANIPDGTHSGPLVLVLPRDSHLTIEVLKP